MKFNKQIIIILVIFFKTETLLCENNLFNVNNIQLEKKDKITNKALADKAIKKGFNQLISKILLKNDKDRLSDLSFPSIKKLVTYYQVSNETKEKKNQEIVSFSITFDKDKMHELFYSRGISYSEITDKEIFILPILIEKNDIRIFNNNFFYKNWNKKLNDDLIEFILPIENIEIIQNINENKNNLMNLDINKIFPEYPNKNLASILIEDNKINNIKVYIKTKVQEKNVSRSLNIKRQKFKPNELNDKIITEVKNELINIVKSVNLIDVRTPSFLNIKMNLNSKSNLVELNLRVKNIESIENVFVQEFNKDFIKIRIKYLGKLEKLRNQLKKEKINLQFINDQWVIKNL